MARKQISGVRFNYLSVFEPEEDFVCGVLKSSVVISSSLHALITAVAFGVPICWWWPKFFDDAGDEFGRFKYYDFFASLGIENPQYTREIGVPGSEMLRIPVPATLTQGLFQAFPKSI